MRRLAVGGLAVLFISIFLGFMIGCGGSSQATGLPSPRTVTLTAPSTSIDLGTMLPLTASANPAVTTPILYSSSNPSVLSFVPAAGGLACAGRWDADGTVCHPQSVGVAQVTATANGVTSAPVTIYVHQHIDQITMTLLDQLTPLPTGNCVTLGTAPGLLNYLDFQAQAFSNGSNITNSVGSFSFQQTNSTVARITLTDSELNNHNGNQITQARITAAVPGITQVFATVAGVNSQPVVIGGNPYFETCQIQSINLQVGNDVANTTFTTSGGQETVTANAVDRLGYTLTNPPLTWISLSPAIATVGNTGAVSPTKNPGVVGIVAACLPSNCNITTPGVQPIKPVYSTTLSPDGKYIATPILGTVTGATVTTNAYATTTQCNTAAGSPIVGCQPLLYPISTSNNTVSASSTLPSSPNSFVFAPGGSKAFLGSAAGLMTFTPGTATIPQFNNIPGKVLAVSSDGNHIIVSDTVSSPNQVYIVDVSSATAPRITASVFISGATAASFSSEGLRAFIIGANNLYVYSTLLPQKTVPLAGIANAVAPFANGALSYLSGGSASPAINLFNTCDTTYGISASIPVPRLPTMFQAVPDGVHAIGFDPPGVDVFAVKGIGPTPATMSQPNSTTCPFIVAPPDPPEQEFTFANLGQGNFTPLKLIISSDNSKAYILASNLSSIFIYSFGVNTVSAIPLTGGPVPLDAGLTADGTVLYVGTSDGTVHVVSTTSGGDVQQIAFTNDNATNKGSLCSNIPQNCTPDLIAVQPK